MHNDHNDYVITKVPTAEEQANALHTAMKKLILEKPEVLLECSVADEIRKEIANEKKQRRGKP